MSAADRSQRQAAADQAGRAERVDAVTRDLAADATVFTPGARVRATDPRPGSRQWRHWAVCTACPWHGYRFDSIDSAEKQAARHNTENHPEES